MSHDALATSSQYPLGHPVLPYSVLPKSLGALPLQTLELFPRIHIGQAGAFCAGPDYSCAWKEDCPTLPQKVGNKPKGHLNEYSVRKYED